MKKAGRVHYAWIVLACSTLVVFGALGLARFGYSIILPAMQQGLGLDNTGAGALATANLVGYLALSLLGGALASRYGPRWVATIGMGLVSAGMALTGAANSLLSAMVWRALTGIGSGASNVPVMGLVAAWFGPRRRGLAAGIAVAGSSLGLMVSGPLVPRILAANPFTGWRVSWYLFAAAALGLAWLAALLLRDRPAQIGLQPLGGDSEAPASSSPGDPSLPWRVVYLAPRVWHLGAVYAAFGFSYIIYMTFFVRFLVSEAGYSARRAGGLFMLMGAFSLACGLIWGALSDRIGRKWALALVFLTHSLAFSLFVLWPQPPGLTLSAVLFGLSAWSIPAIMAAACGDVLGARMAPAALGFITLFFGVGQAVAPSVAGAMADASGSFTTAFLLAAGVALLGALGSLGLRIAPQAQPASLKTAGG